MRLLFVSRAYFPATSYGGPVSHLRKLCRLLAVANHDVHVICSNLLSPGMKGQLSTPGRFIIDGVKVHYLHSPLRYRWDGIPPAAVGEIPKAVRRADLVHVAGTRHFLGALAESSARRRAVPYFVMPEGSIPPRFRNIGLKRIVDAVHTRRSLDGAYRVVATSEAEADELHGWGVPRQRLLLLPPRADQIQVSPRTAEELKPEWGANPGQTVLFWMGRIHPEKGLPVLFEAMEDPRLRETLLLLAGTAEDRALERALRNRASTGSLIGRIRFLGWVGHGEKAELMRMADLFAFPSRKENFGLAAAEAVTAGVPVVLTKGCGVAPLIDGRAGLACDYDPRSLADTLARVIQDRDLAAKLREGTAIVAKELDWPPLVAYLEEVYREAVEVNRR